MSLSLDSIAKNRCPKSRPIACVSYKYGAAAYPVGRGLVQGVVWVSMAGAALVKVQM